MGWLNEIARFVILAVVGGVLLLIVTLTVFVGSSWLLHFAKKLYNWKGI